MVVHDFFLPQRKSGNAYQTLPSWFIAPKFYLFLLLFLHFELTYSQPKQDPQNKIELRNPNSNFLQIPYDPNKRAGNLISSDSVQRWIVRFKGTSSTNNNSAGGGHASSNDHEQFESDFRKIVSLSGSRTRGGAAPKIERHYERVFNGVSFMSTADHVEIIRKLSYVDKVLHDHPIKVNDETSNQLIQAPRVWTELGLTGDGVTIGIIDTGIDYTHKALGGDFGPDKKVFGGYDFVNDDSDPKDDHGHGTHVAGIAAANGSNLQGVAPNAKLFALKALDASGIGFDSWILAAIERAVDPDQNPATLDRLDIVNMSLGRAMDPFEPLSEAVNNAVQHGVVFVVAGGNSGTGYQTIGTPGVAEKAITVAASDNFDVVAQFSSRGPTHDFMMKPDITAPGVSILSSVLGNQLESLSGTSMASPHVAGAAALLLQQNPDWSPEIIKSVLMQNVVKIGQNSFEQGAGRVDVFKAINAKSSVSPAIISLGLPDKTQELDQRVFELSVANFENSTKTYDLSIAFLEPFFQAELSTNSLTVSGKSAGTFFLTISITGNSVPINSIPSYFSGAVIVESGPESIEVPVALLNPRVTTLKFGDTLPSLVTIFNPNSFFVNFLTPEDSETEVLLADGEYDFFASYPDFRFVAREKISVESTSEILLYENLATHRIDYQPKDENGQLLPFLDNTFGLTGIWMEDNFSGFFSVTNFPAQTIYINSVSDRYQIDLKYVNSSQGSKKLYDYSSTIKGVSSSLTIENQPDKISQVKFVLANSVSPGSDVSTYAAFGRVDQVLIIFWNYELLSVGSDLNVFVEKVNPSSRIAYSAYDFLSTGSQFSFSTPLFKLNENNTVTYSLNATGNQTMTEALETISPQFQVGKGLLQCHSTLNYFYDRLRIEKRSFANGFFTGLRGDKILGPINFKIIHNNFLQESGQIYNQPHRNQFLIDNTFIEIEKPTGQYEVSLEYDQYQVGNRFGKATTRLHFNSDHDDNAPPGLHRLELWSKGRPTDNIEVGSPAYFFVDTYDGCEFGCPNPSDANIATTVRIKSNEQWITLTSLLPQKFDLPDNISNGYYDLEITITDYAGNYFQYTLEPGFVVGTPDADLPFERPVLLNPRHESVGVPINPTFSFSPLTSSETYTVQVSKNSSFEERIEVVVATTSFKLQGDLDANQAYYWRVKANYLSGESLWSNTGTFTTGSAVVLSFPPANAVDLGFQEAFKWLRVKFAVGYEFQICLCSDFKESFQSFQAIITSDTTANVTLGSPNSNYHWRVRAILNGGLSSWSETREFQTASAPITETNDVLNEYSVYPNPSTKYVRFILPNPHCVIRIYDAMGHQVALINPPSSTFEWSIDSLSSGLYLISFENNISAVRKRLLIQK